MTPQEQQMLQELTDRINQTQLPEKDTEAEQFLQRSLGRNPDATYILAQTVLVTQYALEQAQKQLSDLKSQQQQAPPPPQKHTSFLGNLLGMNDEDRQAPPPPPPYGNQPQYAPVPNQQPQYGNPQYGQAQYGGQPQYGAPQQQGGFLRSAMQTATGVAAGALAFQGIESLMHGFGGGERGFEGGRPEEIVNNYYGDSAGGGEHHAGDFQDRLSSDIEDRRDDKSQSFADTSNDDSTDDGSNDDSSNDDSFSDDSGSDDSGSYDDSNS